MGKEEYTITDGEKERLGPIYDMARDLVEKYGNPASEKPGRKAVLANPHDSRDVRGSRVVSLVQDEPNSAIGIAYDRVRASGEKMTTEIFITREGVFKYLPLKLDYEDKKLVDVEEVKNPLDLEELQRAVADARNYLDSMRRR